MTVVETGTTSVQSHLGELALRRLRASELSSEKREQADQHLLACNACRSKLRMLVEEQRAFERDIPFERFAGGVERAKRVPRPSPRRAWTLGLASTLAAAAVAVFFIRVSPGAHNRSKGTLVDATLRVADRNATSQRSVPPGSHEVLAPGDRMRLGYRTEDAGFLAAVSVDDRGEVTPLYPESGAALPVGPSRETAFLPDSIELTGAGNERVFLFLARAPFALSEAVQAVTAAYAQAKGDLRSVQNPAFSGGQQVFSWLFAKP